MSKRKRTSGSAPTVESDEEYSYRSSDLSDSLYEDVDADEIEANYDASQSSSDYQQSQDSLLSSLFVPHQYTRTPSLVLVNSSQPPQQVRHQVQPPFFHQVPRVEVPTNTLASIPPSSSSLPAPIVINIADDDASATDETNTSSRSEVETDGKPKKARSQIYEHFTWDDKLSKWQCNYCQAAYKNHVGSLNNHISRSHKSRVIANTNRITNHFPTIEVENTTEVPVVITREEFERKLVKFVVCSNQPFSIVQEEVFLDLMSSASSKNPICALPERRQLKKSITDTYREEKEKLKHLMHAADARISFTSDCWSSSNNYAFQGVTASWIDNNWALQNVVVDLSLLDGPHTGENLAEAFSNVLQDFNLWQKVLVITTDNATNMNTMFNNLDEMAIDMGSDFNSKDYRVRCMAHIINLSCQAALKQIDSNTPLPDEGNDFNFEFLDSSNIISKIRKAVIAIRSSPQRRAMLFKQSEVCGLSSKNLIRDVKTRWNSTLNMLERARELAQPIQLTLQAYGLNVLLPTQEEWIMMDHLITLLKPFREATVCLSSASQPVMSHTTSIYEILFSHLEAYLPSQTTNVVYRTRTRGHDSLNNYPEWLVRSAQAAWEKLKTYYPSSDGLAYVTATILDPRYKDKWYQTAKWNQAWIENCRKAVRKLWNTNYKQKESVSSDVVQSRENPTLSNMERKIFEQMQTMQKGNTADELTKYLKESVVMPETINAEFGGVLRWWQTHQHEYPCLAKMAKDFLAISGTGVPAERLFSSAVDLLSPRRQRLSPETIRECLCLKNWLNMDENIFLDSVQFKVFGSVNQIQEAETSSGSIHKA